MRTVTVSWDVPATREDGKVLPKSEIQDTEVLVAPVAANGTVGTFVSLAKVKPDATQTVNQGVPDGTYRFRFIVTDTFGQRGKAVEGTAIVKSAPPGEVVNIKFVVS